jgi:hypothetical protein
LATPAADCYDIILQYIYHKIHEFVFNQNVICSNW